MEMTNQAQSAKQKSETTQKQRATRPACEGPVALTVQADPLVLQRTIADPRWARPADMLALHRAYGNRAVTRLIQTKLMVGPVGDRYEREADRVAEQVMSMPNPQAVSGQPPLQRQAPEEEEEKVQTKPLVQRQAEEEEEEIQTKPLVQRQAEEEEEEIQTKPLVQRQAEEEEEEIQTKPLVQRQAEEEEEEEIQTKPLVQRQAEEEEEEIQTKPLVQRQAEEEEEEIQTKPLVQRQAEEEEEEIQTKPLVQRQADGSFEAGSELESRLAAHKGDSRPLPGDIRTFMEPRFDADFSQVRVHADADSAQVSQSIQARAFTHGSHIYFGAGQYDPSSNTGKRLLAHELAHVVQQNGGTQLKRGPEQMTTPLRHEVRTSCARPTTTADIGVVQRALQGAYQALKAAGGKVSGTATAKKFFTFGRGTSTYDKILSAVSDYEKKEQAGTKPRDWFLQKLVTIENLCNAWLDDADHKGDIQAGEPKAVARAGALMDLLRQVEAERTSVAPPAQLTALGLNVDDAVPHGHGMNVTLAIQCPAQPTPSHIPHTAYGISLEYWERIEVDYDFKADAANAPASITAHEGQKEKQWNDIYALAPAAGTWGKIPGTADYSWKQAVESASRGELTGTVTVGFRDQPAFVAKNQRYGKRVLRFRIVARDQSGHRQEILATQTIQLNGGTTSTKRFDVGTLTPAPTTAVTGPTVVTTGTAPVFVPNIPPAANVALPGFVQNLRRGQGMDFDNQELDQVRQICTTHGQPNMIDYLYPKIGRVGPGGTELAGVNLTPCPQPGQRYKQCPVGGGGLLVALIQGARILKMYYTDGTLGTVQHGELFDVPIQVRSFAEIPIETVDAVP
jgi:hypothetical protein